MLLRVRPNWCEIGRTWRALGQGLARFADSSEYAPALTTRGPNSAKIGPELTSIGLGPEATRSRSELARDDHGTEFWPGVGQIRANRRNSTDRFVESTNIYPESTRLGPGSATIGPSWLNFGRKVARFRPTFARMRPMLCDVGRIRHGFGQHVARFGRTWSDLDQCWPECGQSWAISAMCWPGPTTCRRCCRILCPAILFATFSEC